MRVLLCSPDSLFSLPDVCVLVSQDGKTVNYFLNNHVRFRVLYHKESKLSRVVGFEVEPYRCVPHGRVVPWRGPHVAALCIAWP